MGLQHPRLPMDQSPPPPLGHGESLKLKPWRHPNSGASRVPAGGRHASKRSLGPKKDEHPNSTHVNSKVPEKTAGAVPVRGSLYGYLSRHWKRFFFFFLILTPFASNSLSLRSFLAARLRASSCSAQRSWLPNGSTWLPNANKLHEISFRYKQERAFRFNMMPPKKLK